jgi:hypothetical protein
MNKKLPKQFKNYLFICFLVVEYGDSRLIITWSAMKKPPFCSETGADKPDLL